MAPKVSDAAIKAEPASPRAVSPNRLSMNKELPPIPAPRPASPNRNSVSPNKRNSVSPTKGGDRAAESPAPQELKDLLVKLDDKVRSAARYLVDEQSSLWVQNLDNVRAPVSLLSCSKLVKPLFTPNTYVCGLYRWLNSYSRLIFFTRLRLPSER
jgi:hypothetical protein